MITKYQWLMITLSLLLISGARCDYDVHLSQISLSLSTWKRMIFTSPDSSWIFRGHEELLHISTHNDTDITYRRTFPPQDHSKLYFRDYRWPITDNHLTASGEPEPSSKCNGDFLYSRLSLEKNWACRLFDSWGKPHSGIIQGGLQWPGSYKECQGVRAPPSLIDNITVGGFSGHYCWLAMGIKFLDSNGTNRTLPVKLGVCAPSSCNEEQMLGNFEWLREYLVDEPFIKKMLDNITFENVRCMPEKTVGWGSVLFSVFLSFFVLLVLLGTCLDCLVMTDRAEHLQLPHQEISSISAGIAIGENAREDILQDTVVLETPIFPSNEEDAILDVPPMKGRKKIFSRLLHCFSLKRNTRQILGQEKIKSGHFHCVDGIRVLSLIWIIFGHTYLYAQPLLENVVELVDSTNELYYQAVFQSTLAIDTFFLLSGFLVSYSFFKRLDQRKEFSWLFFYLHRLWRLMPTYIMVLWLNATLWQHIGEGPFWSYDDGKYCRKSWWWNILFMNNFHKVQKTCMAWTWYLAVDLQFHLISPLFLFAFTFRRRRYAWLLIILFVGVSCMTTGLLSYKNNFQSLTDMARNFAENSTEEYLAQSWNFFNVLYDKPYCRISPYIIGIVLGYLFNAVVFQDFAVQTWQAYLLWTLILLSIISIVFGLYFIQLSSKGMAVYNSVFRTVWAITISLMLAACVFNYGGIVNSFLCLPVFGVLRHLNYSAYLIHPMIISAFYNNMKTTIYFSSVTMVAYTLTFICWSYFMAFFAYLLFEAPARALEEWYYALPQFE